MKNDKRKFVAVLNYPGEYKTVFDVHKTGEYDSLFIKASSLDQSWSKPGETLLYLQDTGNGYVLHFKDKKLELLYCEAEELFTALKIINDFSTHSKSVLKLMEMK
jgi:hypothetical protein